MCSFMFFSYAFELDYIDGHAAKTEKKTKKNKIIQSFEILLHLYLNPMVNVGVLCEIK